MPATIINLLNASRIGCHISDVCINHVFYADDLCLMAPCAIALQELLNICYRYSVEVNLNFNATKSFCVAFTPKHYKLSLPPLFMNISPIMYQGWGQVLLTKYSSTPSTPNIYQVQVLVKYSFF